MMTIVVAQQCMISGDRSAITDLQSSTHRCALDFDYKYVMAVNMADVCVAHFRVYPSTIYKIHNSVAMLYNAQPLIGCELNLFWRELLWHITFLHPAIVEIVLVWLTMHGKLGANPFEHIRWRFGKCVTRCPSAPRKKNVCTVLFQVFRALKNPTKILICKIRPLTRV